MANSTSHPKSSGPGCVTGFVLCTFLFVAGTGYATYRYYDFLIAVIQKAEKASDNFSRAIAQVFQTKVNVEGSSFTLNRSQIKELALLQNQIVVITKYERSHLGLNATVIIRGIYRAKTGFALEGAGPIRMDSRGRLDIESLPKPKLLSLETVEQGIFFQSANIINQPNSTDVETAYAENRAQAFKDAAESGILEETGGLLAKQLTDLIEVQQLLDQSQPAEMDNEIGQDASPDAVNPARPILP